MIHRNEPVENQQVIGDYYPRPARPAPDPDSWLEMWTATADEVSRFHKRIAKCPHNCKGCTCRTDPRQLSLPFPPHLDAKN